MGLIGWIIAAVAGGAIGKKIYDNHKEEQRRKNTPFFFNRLVSESDFNNIVYKVAKRIKRVSVSINGPIVYGTVKSQSGISTWKFTLDFNDYGELTGTCWLWKENSDSNIPEIIRDEIQEELSDLL